MIAAVIGVAALAGCATPRTHFDWGMHQPAHHARIAAARHSEPVRPACACNNEVPTPGPRPTPAWYQQTGDATPPAHHDAQPVKPAGNGAFMWPLNGRVISEYGAATGGERNDGINIAASTGEPIRAAADGTVSYSGNDLKSYGNLALIKHDNGYVTAYAHADRFVVGRGDHVARGQVIGYAGSTGDVSSCQLHFEIRRGVTPVNPRPLLGPLRVAAN